MNLGNALTTLGERESGTETAHRGGETLAEIGRSYNVSGWTIARLSRLFGAAKWQIPIRKIFTSRVGIKNASCGIVRLERFHATATASRHIFIAAARKTRCDLAEIRWR
jgi:hypothetical protein